MDRDFVVCARRHVHRLRGPAPAGLRADAPRVLAAADAVARRSGRRPPVGKTGLRAQVVEILLESGKLFDDNPACRLYLVAESADDPDLIWVADLWTSEEEHAEALKVPEMRQFVEKCMPLLESMPEQIRVLPVGGKTPGG